MDATFDETKDFVEELYLLADELSGTIKFSANAELQESLKYERRMKVKASRLRPDALRRVDPQRGDLLAVNF